MPENTTQSELAAKRVRALRMIRRLTLTEAAEGITQCGYSISMGGLHYIESGRRKSLPFDLVVAAATFFTPGYGGPNIPGFLYGPLCSDCQDQPPHKFICRTCHRAWNDEGTELIPC